MAYCTLHITTELFRATRVSYVGNLKNINRTNDNFLTNGSRFVICISRCSKRVMFRSVMLQRTACKFTPFVTETA